MTFSYISLSGEKKQPDIKKILSMVFPNYLITNRDGCGQHGWSN